MQKLVTRQELTNSLFKDFPSTDYSPKVQMSFRVSYHNKPLYHLVPTSSRVEITCPETMNDDIKEIIDRCGMYNLEAEFNPAKRLSDKFGSIEVDALSSIPTARLLLTVIFITGLSMSSLRLDKKLTLFLILIFFADIIIQIS